MRNTIQPTAAGNSDGVLKATRREHAEFIGGCLQKGVEGFIEAGEGLRQAKHELPHGEYEAMVRDDLRMDPSTARRLAAIASHPVISNRAHGHALPPSWRTLYELSKLPQALLLTKITEGAIHPQMERKDVRALLPAPDQRDDDLPPDYEGSADPEAETAAPANNDVKLKDELTAEEISRFAYKLIQLDIELARDLNDILWRGGADQLASDLNTGIEIEGRGLVETVEAEAAIAPPKKRGRPPGSKNKPKSPPAENTAAPPQRGEDNAPSPEVGAEIMKAQFAALDDGLDVPPFLRRTA
jgi:hypothetical protein